MANIEEGLFSKLIDNVNDGIYFLDTERKVTYWNQASEAISGYETAEIMGKRCSENILVHINEWGEKLCDKDCPVKKTLEDGQNHETIAYLQHKEGYRIPIMMRAIPIKDREGKMIGASNISAEEETVQTTISIGATQAMLSDTTDSLIKRGHQLMKKSKETGKNTVSLG